MNTNKFKTQLFSPIMQLSGSAEVPRQTGRGCHGDPEVETRTSASDDERRGGEEICEHI